MGGKWRNVLPVIVKGMAVLAVYIAAKDLLPTLHY